MNDLLELKGTLESDKNESKPNPQLPSNKTISAKTLTKLLNDLSALNTFWNSQNIISGALVSVYYNRVIPKSSRIKSFMSERSENSNLYIRGVRFDGDNKKHIITYYISKKVLQKCITIIESLIDIINTYYNGVMDNEKMKSITGKEKYLTQHGFSKSS